MNSCKKVNRTECWDMLSDLREIITSSDTIGAKTTDETGHSYIQLYNEKLDINFVIVRMPEFAASLLVEDARSILQEGRQ